MWNLWKQDFPWSTYFHAKDWEYQLPDAKKHSVKEEVVSWVVEMAVETFWLNEWYESRNGQYIIWVKDNAYCIPSKLFISCRNWIFMWFKRESPGEGEHNGAVFGNEKDCTTRYWNIWLGNEYIFEHWQTLVCERGLWAYRPYCIICC